MSSVPLKGPVVGSITLFRQSVGATVTIHNVGIAERALSPSLTDHIAMASLRVMAARVCGMPMDRLNDQQVLQTLTGGLLSGELVLDES